MLATIYLARLATALCHLAVPPLDIYTTSSLLLLHSSLHTWLIGQTDRQTALVAAARNNMGLMDPSGHIWTHQDTSGPIRTNTYLDLP
jgi:hypothetical protein